MPASKNAARGTAAVRGRRSFAGRRLAGVAVIACLAGSFFVVGPAQADTLEDQAQALQAKADDVAASLEFVDGKIAKSAADLTLYQGQLPGAQQALADAQSKVAGAAAQVDTLAARVDLAQENKDKITSQIVADEHKAADTRKLIGEIATQSYKSGGVPTNLSLLFGSSGDSTLASSMDLADAAMRSQNAALDKISEQNATHVNVQARLAAVEGEIQDLKAKADAALAVEQAARDDAAAKKSKVDTLIANTAALSQQLAAQKPQIQAALDTVKKQQDQIAAQIAERQRKEREAAEAAARAAAAAAGNNNYVAPPPGNPSAFGLRHPFAADVPITSGWGWRTVPAGTIDFNGTGSYLHTGIDFGAPCGTPVYAPAAGTVTTAGWTNLGGGNTVMISHGVIQGNALTTVYYHNTSVTVSVGQHVDAGTLIAYTGSTGNSTGCHAHFETWLNGSPVDPMTLL